MWQWECSWSWSWSWKRRCRQCRPVADRIGRGLTVGAVGGRGPQPACARCQFGCLPSRRGPRGRVSSPRQPALARGRRSRGRTSAWARGDAGLEGPRVAGEGKGFAVRRGATQSAGPRGPRWHGGQSLSSTRRGRGVQYAVPEQSVQCSSLGLDHRVRGPHRLQAKRARNFTLATLEQRKPPPYRCMQSGFSVVLICQCHLTHCSLLKLILPVCVLWATSNLPCSACTTCVHACMGSIPHHWAFQPIGALHLRDCRPISVQDFGQSVTRRGRLDSRAAVPAPGLASPAARRRPSHGPCMAQGPAARPRARRR